jgi:5-(carboxyamino)imidazole ribonucleotide synthase
VTHVVGVVGGGQLARMMIPAAEALGIEIRVLAEVHGSSAKLAATEVGDYRDWSALRQFAVNVNTLTFDHEHVPTDFLHRLVAEGVSVQPGPDALVFAQDKAAMRQRLATIDVPLPAWAVATTVHQVEAFIADQGGHAIAKTPRGGYDGKGVRVVSAGDDVADWLEAGPVLMEQKVDFVREVSQMVARRPSGDTVAYPLVETIQKDGVCSEVIAPAPDTSADQVAEAARIGVHIAESLGVTGMLAVEMFVTDSGRFMVNELAMRPHNSGHVFTEGAITSQFEQHLRAVSDWPLGSPTLRHPWSVMVNLFGDAGNDRVRRILDHSPRVSVHAYGKSPRPGRKAGHLVVSGVDLDEVLTLARAAGAIGASSA